MNLNSDLACDLVIKLRRLNGKASADPHVAASNGVDDGMDGALRTERDTGVRADIEGLIAGLDQDARTDLIALMLWGRDRAHADMSAAREAARRIDAGADVYVFDQPLAAEHLRAGLDKAGVVCEGLDGAV